jgi:hypothetical protein
MCSILKTKVVKEQIYMRKLLNSKGDKQLRHDIILCNLKFVCKT